MRFAELRDNLFNVLAGRFSRWIFPKVRYDSLSNASRFGARFKDPSQLQDHRRRQRLLDGLQPGLYRRGYRWIGRVQQLGADLYLGPLYTWGVLGGRTDFYAIEPLFIDYSHNFR